MIELMLIALAASFAGLIGPFGLGWLWYAGLARQDSTISVGLIYWLGLMSLGALIFLGYGLGAARAAVVSLVALTSAAGWIWAMLRGRIGVAGVPGAAVFLLPLALLAVAYCVLDPVRLWDSYLIWLARVRLIEQWVPISELRNLDIIYPEYPFLGAATW